VKVRLRRENDINRIWASSPAIAFGSVTSGSAGVKVNNANGSPHSAGMSTGVLILDEIHVDRVYDLSLCHVDSVLLRTTLATGFTICGTFPTFVGVLDIKAKLRHHACKVWAHRNLHMAVSGQKLRHISSVHYPLLVVFACEARWHLFKRTPHDRLRIVRGPSCSRLRCF
jgi:hypothetical protein